VHEFFLPWEIPVAAKAGLSALGRFPNKLPLGKRSNTTTCKTKVQRYVAAEMWLN